MDIVLYSLMKKKLDGKANLVGGKIPAEELPSYVDDVIEYSDIDHFPTTGEEGKIYVALDTGSTYRWSGSGYVKVGSGDILLSITYEELVATRNAGQLIPGMQYRITDYDCTTSTPNTHSANHHFDIIVSADDESHLNEVARACHSDRDTNNYFANSKLEAWEIKYCLDNDANRFEWADSANGKGVIYYMKDEFNNEVPYDFKNIIYETRLGFVYKQWGSSYTFVRDSSLDAGGYYGWRCDRTPSAWSNPYCFTNTLNINTSMDLYSNTSGSKISYGGSIQSISSVEKNEYTFNTSIYEDNSLNLSINNVCNGNSIKACIRNRVNSYLLNHIIFGNACSSNTFGYNCHDNTFGYNCHSNTFNSDCSGNRFASSCINNKFGYGCFYNTFGDNCYNNTFDSYCQDITFGSNCDNNSFTKGVLSIIFDHQIKYISLTSEEQFDASNRNCIKNIHVHSGISGDSTQNPLVISVPHRDINYSIDYYASNSQEVYL